ncbi:MAG: glycosyltransferase family 2 protein [Actinomycetota bacterium]|nr:glycosyltransferase family 2 protein [Actinomycetota bacterium]
MARNDASGDQRPRSLRGGMVCAIVVTHNRKGLLGECLSGLGKQTRPPERVLVVDNASTDGTPEMLAREFRDVEVLTLPVNEGSAGGFHEGMKRAHANGADWLWLMDDDTVPGPEALAELLAAPARLDGARPPSLLLSKALWRDGRMHPMNTPWPARKRPESMVEGAERGLMPLGSATWISLLVHRGVIDRHGLPLKHFFIWSDDIDYTGRVLAAEAGYLVPTSVVVHKTETPHTAMSAAPDRFYYHVRNTTFIIRGPGRTGRDRVVFAWLLVSSTGEYLARNPSLGGLRAVLRGLRDGLRPLPA